eukprot:7628554-Lingulodinium_polyedra.AAC.1
MEGLGVAVIPTHGHTHRGAQGSSTLDILAVSREQAHRWGVHRRWHPGLSEHAAFVARTHDACTSGAKPCTPG